MDFEYFLFFPIAMDKAKEFFMAFYRASLIQRKMVKIAPILYALSMFGTQKMQPVHLVVK